jgi:type IV secretory pathway VirJ component
LPPPPYASEITALADGVAKAAGSGATMTAAVAAAAMNAALATRVALGLCIGTRVTPSTSAGRTARHQQERLAGTTGWIHAIG